MAVGTPHEQKMNESRLFTAQHACERAETACQLVGRLVLDEFCEEPPCYPP